MTAEPANPRRWTNTLILPLVATLSVVLRMWGATDQFWLDEIHSYQMSMPLHSLRDAVFAVPIEHHVLNTMLMYLIGDQLEWSWYRLPLFAAGVAALLVLLHAVRHDTTGAPHHSLRQSAWGNPRFLGHSRPCSVSD